jgi:hypothetical protein
MPLCLCVFAGDEIVAVAGHSGAAASVRSKSARTGAQRGRPATGHADVSAEIPPTFDPLTKPCVAAF